MIMGTGIVSTLLSVLPYNGRWLRWISIMIFALNVFLFISGYSPLHHVSQNDQSRHLPPGTSDVPWRVPDGSRYYRQHVLLRVCAGLGDMGCKLCLGIVDT